MKVIVGWSDTPGSAAAVVWAKDLVARLGGEIRLVHAVSTFPIATYEGVTEVARMFEAAMAAQSERAKAACDSLKASGVTASFVVDHAIPADMVLREAESWQADLIIVARREMGRIGHLILGSNSAHIVRRAKVATLVVHGEPPTDRPLGVLAALDESPSASRALSLAKTLWPAAHFAAVTVTDEGCDPPLACVKAAGNVPITACAGSPLEVFGTRARDGVQDVFAVGRRGLGFFAELLMGSVSERVVALAKGAVLVVP